MYKPSLLTSWRWRYLFHCLVAQMRRHKSWVIGKMFFLLKLQNGNVLMYFKDLSQRIVDDQARKRAFRKIKKVARTVSPKEVNRDNLKIIIKGERKCQ